MPALLATKEVATALRVDARTIERWTAEGRLPRVRLAPKTIRYRADDVAALIAPRNGEAPAGTAEASRKTPDAGGRSRVQA